MPIKHPAGKGRYSVHPGVAMVQKWVSELKTKTGRSLDEWLALVIKEGPATDSIALYLKPTILRKRPAECVLWGVVA